MRRKRKKIMEERKQERKITMRKTKEKCGKKKEQKKRLLVMRSDLTSQDTYHKTLFQRNTLVNRTTKLNQLMGLTAQRLSPPPPPPRPPLHTKTASFSNPYRFGGQQCFFAHSIAIFLAQGVPASLSDRPLQPIRGRVPPIMRESREEQTVSEISFDKRACVVPTP